MTDDSGWVVKTGAPAGRTTTSTSAVLGRTSSVREEEPEYAAVTRTAPVCGKLAAAVARPSTTGTRAIVDGASDPSAGALVNVSSPPSTGRPSPRVTVALSPTSSPA
ncbi:hypothetical protein Q0F99_10960 [Rathayibacter oskolensis]|uniref:hypothetical protein n=1 Tax=Rathayibacter oskolensis TaxID=1891671 RepID=UPI00265FEB60|nr:hypothetical protein [Rathayibacter oskolensis]WKK70401.1 hypothetical protein Q0F99_10960 [Rathayibacter oskolensis]